VDNRSYASREIAYQPLYEPAKRAELMNPISAAGRVRIGFPSRRRELTAKRGYHPNGGGSTGFRKIRVENQQFSLQVYAATLAGTSVAFGVGAFFADLGVSSSPVVLLLALSALLAERQSVRLTPHLWASVSFLPVVCAAVAYGPFAAMLVGAASFLGDLRRPYLRWLIWTSGRCILAGLAGVAALQFGGSTTHAFGWLLAASAVALVIEQSGSLLLASATIRLRGGTVPNFVGEASAFLLAVPLYSPVIALLLYASRELAVWSLGLFLIPALAAQRLFVLYREQRETAEQLSLANTRLARANLSFATGLVATLDARDRYTAGHSAAVAVYAQDIATRMGLSEPQQELAHLCGLVHDIGKIGLPPGLLEKPGPLTLEERRQMEEHPVIGERILSKVDDYAEIASIVRHHHERVDGEGYPDGLRDDEIPLIARIIGVADAYNAMTSDRPYRDAMPSRVARLRLAQAADTQFDTTVIAAFEAILAAAPESYRAGTRFDFGVELRGVDVASPTPRPVLAAAAN
jgi:putative nucleotidyltransferase with HDIG domain